ncbi:MAG: hypothetical protein CFE23_12200 [Flavobacterium sp. BFFFF1]|nr:MAG: hypothetical protein CFE23_12200 [Flavobacterium sp. BFFFF1]
MEEHTWKDFINSIKEGSDKFKDADFILIIDGEVINDPGTVVFEPIMTKEFSVVNTERKKEHPEPPVITISVTTTDNQIIKESFINEREKG